MSPALLKRKEVFKLRIFRCVAIIIVSAILVTGCKKDVTVAPVKTHSTSMGVTTSDDENPSGGDGTTQNPPH